MREARFRVKLTVVLAVLSAFGCVPQPMEGGAYSDPYQNCVANMRVFDSSVQIPNAVLGTLSSSGSVLTSFGRETAVRNAVWDACGKWPEADAIVNFSGDSKGNSVYYSGVVVKFVTAGTAPSVPLNPTTPDKKRAQIDALKRKRANGTITNDQFETERVRIIMAPDF